MPRPVLLAVDDDPDVLRAVERDLRKQYSDRYRVMSAESGPDALEWGAFKVPRYGVLASWKVAFNLSA